MNQTSSKDWAVASLLAIVMSLLSLSGCVSRNPSAIELYDSWKVGDGSLLTAKILTYNVAGLPDVFSGSHPSVNHLMISPGLNNFDVVLVQEDFWYHDDLSSQVTLPYSSLPTRMGVFGVGDGLNRFATHAFEDYSRITWDKRYGVFRHSNDRLAPKGFTVATHHLSRSIAVDIYNLHMDAGGSHNDYLAREAQIGQLAEVLDEKSRGKPVIVAGDWNLREDRPDDRKLLEGFKEQFSLQDAREVLSVGRDRIDRILYRSGEGVHIVPVTYEVEQDLFRDTEGSPLSDHDAVSVEFLFRSRP